MLRCLPWRRECMRLKLVCLAILFLKSTARAQSVPPDAQITQAMLLEVRQLRQDLQSAASTIQRVKIAMFRLQTGAVLLDRASQRVDQARAGCAGVELQRKEITREIAQAEARKRNSQNSAEQNLVDTRLSQLRSSFDQLAAQEQECQIERVEADTQFRIEQAKMNDLQNQLEKLDRALSGYR